MFESLVSYAKFRKHCVERHDPACLGHSGTFENSVFKEQKDVDSFFCMPMIPYDEPACLFRRYKPWECEENGEGYPYIWSKISEVRLEERLFRCDDCGFAYLEDGDILTVHHCNLNKADCRRDNLDVYCWLHRSQDHESDSNMRDWRCKYCKAYFLGWPRLHRHIKGIHRPFELKIPEITLDQRPTSYIGRGRVLAAIQQQQRWRELWRD